MESTSSGVLVLGRARDSGSLSSFTANGLASSRERFLLSSHPFRILNARLVRAVRALPEAILADHPSVADFDVYACGSPGMIDSARAIFVELGRLQKDCFFADAYVIKRVARDGVGELTAFSTVFIYPS